MQLLNEDNMSLPERLVLEKVSTKKKLKKARNKVQRLVQTEVYKKRIRGYSVLTNT